MPMCKRFYLIVQKDNFTLFFEPLNAKYTDALFFHCFSHTLFGCLATFGWKNWNKWHPYAVPWCASIRANITRLLLICHLIAMLTWCTTTLYRLHTHSLTHTNTHQIVTRAIIAKWQIIIIFILAFNGPKISKNDNMQFIYFIDKHLFHLIVPDFMSNNSVKSMARNE